MTSLCLSTAGGHFGHKGISGQFHDAFESRGLSDSKVSQNLAVQGHVGKLLTMNEVAILKTVFACACVDPLYPQRTHIALQDLSIRVLPHTHQVSPGRAR